MDEEIRPGYYKDKDGVWQKDRRRQPDRRRRDVPFSHHDRRIMYRRKTDQAIMEREAKMQIEEALQDFAEEHGKRNVGSDLTS